MPGCPPVFVAGRGKPVHQPQRRRVVAAVLDEFEPFAVSDEVARQFYRTNQRAMRGFFVVETKTVAGLSDGVDALVQRDPFAAGAGGGGKLPVRIVGGRD